MSARRRGRGALWGILPFALLLLVVGAAPFFVAFGDSFWHDVYGERSWAGLDNYRFLLKDEAFGISARITLLWAALETVLVVAVGYTLAVALFESKRGGWPIYAALLVPWGVPAFISVPLWRMLIHGAAGDSVIASLFGIRINLLTDGPASFAAALFVSVWMSAPAAAFVIYGALRKLPARVIEAARLDGAGRAALSRRVYLPLVRGSIAAIAAFEFVKAFKEFSVPFLLTAGGPPLLSGITARTIVGATTTLEVYLYDLFQGAEDYGLAAAYSAASGAAVILLVALALLATKAHRLGESVSRIADSLARGLGLGRVARSQRAAVFVRGGLVSGTMLFEGRAGDRFALVTRYVLAAFACLSSLLIVFALVRTSLSGLSSAYIDAIAPPFMTVSNFPAVFVEDGAGRAFLNTLAVSLATACLAPLVVIPAALALRRASPASRALVFALVQASGSAGGMHSLVPLYAMFRAFGLVGGYVPLVVVYLFHAAPFALFASTAFLDSLPPSMEESALLEGASKRQILLRVVMPLAMPVVALTAMNAFLASWNGFLVPLVFLNDDSLYTIGIRLYSYVGSAASGAPKWNRFAAASIVNLLIVGAFLWRLKGPLGRAPTSDHEE